MSDGLTGTNGPNDGAYCNVCIRRAASEIRQAIGFMFVGYMPKEYARPVPENHPLVKALEALALADQETVHSANTTHAPELFKSEYQKNDNRGLALLIMAHTQVQLEVFLRKHPRIGRKNVRRVTSLRLLEAVSTILPLVLLPGWQECRNADEIVAVWHHRGGAVVKVSESRALGEVPLCDNDTNGDGDCHLCSKRGGCDWPKSS